MGCARPTARMKGPLFPSAALLTATTFATQAPATATTNPGPATGAAATPLAAAPRLDVATVAERVQKRYDGAADFRASFNQTLTNTAFKRRTPSTGEVLLKKPGRMRWNYKTPEPKMYLSDGDLLWLYEPEDKPAFRQDL